MTDYRRNFAAGVRDAGRGALAPLAAPVPAAGRGAAAAEGDGVTAEARDAKLPLQAADELLATVDGGG